MAYQLGLILLVVALTAAVLAALVQPSSCAPAPLPPLPPLSARRRRPAACSSTSCGGSGWRRVASLDMSDPAQSCPEGWREIATPRRTCGRIISGVQTGCDSVIFPNNGEPYSHVCGKIVGYQFSQTMAFARYNRHPDSLTIDDAYVDGVSVTHGRLRSREHIWTLASAWSELAPGDGSSCPCSSSPATPAVLVPPWVSSHYFCDTAAPGAHGFPPAVFFENVTLWDGRGCRLAGSCCKPNSPPVFCRELPQPTTDDIEVRLCGADGNERADTPIELIEIFVR